MTDPTTDPQTDRPEVDDPRVLALANARQQMAYKNPFNVVCPPWDGLTDQEQHLSLLDARNYLRAAIDAGLVAAVPSAPAELANLRAMYDAVSAREHELIEERDKLVRWHGEDEAAFKEMRATIERMRGERAEVIRQRDQIAMDTMKAVGADAADRAELRDCIAEALISWSYRGQEPDPEAGILETVRANAYSRADAVLAVLPPPADRAAVLREVAEVVFALDFDELRATDSFDSHRQAWELGTIDAHNLLRRMADEAEHEEPVRCPLCADARALDTPAEAREHFTTVHPEERLVGSGPWPLLANRADEAQQQEPTHSCHNCEGLADELGTDLYRAQDALAFVGECCDIADRNQHPITTADVREWLKGARCGRQLAAQAGGLTIDPAAPPLEFVTYTSQQPADAAAVVESGKEA